jgi:hypothetical protein
MLSASWIDWKLYIITSEAIKISKVKMVARARFLREKQYRICLQARLIKSKARPGGEVDMIRVLMK